MDIWILCLRMLIMVQVIIPILIFIGVRQQGHIQQKQNFPLCVQKIVL
ncbi:hypothetical protein OMAG_001954 [Candidatus Omnitrophus magneticus]|uniref:Uncharacterized protein n=1 Tax=Candidatus Omnitrophus magneticus TaxID=1609969 RepID=A0A0F0CRQ7_9BACT|nr:hypothetical protein OMAG_001954 [Candidatus Omnitrophus magneticus]